ncbi:MAG: glycosyltransferase family 9 protein [Pseudomonadota bacterium]
MSSFSKLLNSPPASVCLLRLSAIGDTCHALAVLRRLQAAWPATRFTWIIGKFEHKLMQLAPDVEFISYDKKGGLRELRRLRGLLAQRRFDLLLHMQLALRASAIAALVRAPIKLGFDRRRARELQWLFTNRRIADRGNEHVLDGLFGFADALGVAASPPRWDLPLPASACAYAQTLIPDTQPTLLISACSSHALRNWRAERYAAVADHAAAAHGMRVILCGGPGPSERAMAEAILAACQRQPLDQVGKDTLPELLALMARATAIVTPDSGPAHMGTLVGLPVIGLYAATNPARSGPYLSRAHCVDRYPDAARTFLGREPEELPWTTKIERPGVMDLITPDDVCARLDAVLAAVTG